MYIHSVIISNTIMQHKCGLDGSARLPSKAICFALLISHERGEKKSKPSLIQSTRCESIDMISTHLLFPSSSLLNSGPCGTVYFFLTESSSHTGSST